MLNLAENPFRTNTESLASIISGGVAEFCFGGLSKLGYGADSYVFLERKSSEVIKVYDPLTRSVGSDTALSIIEAYHEDTNKVASHLEGLMLRIDALSVPVRFCTAPNDPILCHDLHGQEVVVSFGQEYVEGQNLEQMKENPWAIKKVFDCDENLFDEIENQVRHAILDCMRKDTSIKAVSPSIYDVNMKVLFGDEQGLRVVVTDLVGELYMSYRGQQRDRKDLRPLNLLT